MQAKAPDAFALKNSGLDGFLYADVGSELNGSALTILSMIARLGHDPWAEAARWAALPRAGVIDSLARSIAQMPLAPSALAETRVTAARLALLLPAPAQAMRQDGAGLFEHSEASKRTAITIVYCALAAGMALSVLLQPHPAAPTATPTWQAAGTKVPGTRTQTAGGEAAPPTAAGPSAEQQARPVPGEAETSFPDVALGRQ